MSGPALVLQFIVSLLGTDLEQWYDHLQLAGGGEMTGTAQPLLAKVLCSSSSVVQWNRRCETLCSKYIDALQIPSSPLYVSCLRSAFSRLLVNTNI